MFTMKLKKCNKIHDTNRMLSVPLPFKCTNSFVLANLTSHEHLRLKIMKKNYIIEKKYKKMSLIR